MNQYGYGQNQQMFNQQLFNQQPQSMYSFGNTPNTPYVSGINWAQGIEGAKAFRMKPNDMVIILDSENEGVMYIKTSDSIGMCTLRTFNYHEVTQQLANNKHDVDMSEYVKTSELDARVEAVVNKLLGGGTNE